MKQKRGKRWAIMAAMSAISCLAFCELGCQKLESQSRRSEQQVDEVARQALQREQAQRPQMYEQVANQVFGKSDAATARARQLQAMAEYNAGTSLMQKANNQASELALNIADINHLLTTIQSSNALVVGYGHYHSGPIKQLARKQVARINGSSADSEWVEGKHPIPSLTAVKKTIADLEAQIQKKQDQIDSISKQRVEKLRKAEDLSERADKSTGKAWVELYKQASDLRKQAADMATHADVIESEMQPLKVKLSIAKKNQEIARDAITAIQKQAQGAEENIAMLSQAGSSHHEFVQGIYENRTNATTQSTGPQSLKDKVDALMTQARQVQTTWEAAAKLLADSAQHFKDAQTAAESLQVGLDQRAVALPPDSPQRRPIEQLKNVYNPSLYQYHRAIALQALGTLSADQLASVGQLATVRRDLESALRKADLPVPESLHGADFRQQIAEIKKTGRESFKTSNDLLQNVVNAPLANAEQRNSARAARVIELYAWYKFEQEMGNPRAEARLKAAHEAIKAARENNATLPILPLELQPQIAMPTTAPTTAPTTNKTKA